MNTQWPAGRIGATYANAFKAMRDVVAGLGGPEALEHFDKAVELTAAGCWDQNIPVNEKVAEDLF